MVKIFALSSLTRHSELHASITHKKIARKECRYAFFS